MAHEQCCSVQGGPAERVPAGAAGGAATVEAAGLPPPVRPAAAEARPPGAAPPGGAHAARPLQLPVQPGPGGAPP